MKFIKILDKPSDNFNLLTNLPLISNNLLLLLFLLKGNISLNLYRLIYKLLFTTLKNYLLITSNYFNNINTINLFVTNSNYITNKYLVLPFEFDPEGKLLLYKKTVPLFVILNTTLPLKTIFKNLTILINFNSDFYHKESLYIDNNIDGIVNIINKKYLNLQDGNPCRFTLQVVLPPKTMVRYVNKSLKLWLILSLPRDFILTEININGLTLLIFLNKKVTTSVGNSISKSAVYPSIKNLLRLSILVTGSNISKLLTSFNLNDSNLLKNSSQYISSSLNFMNFNVNYDFNGNSKYLQSIYTNKVIKNIDVDYYSLLDKLGYYNSLIPNLLVLDVRVYRNTTNLKSFLTWRGEYDDYIFDSNLKSNIFSLIYGKLSEDINYGFMNLIGKYKILCYVKLTNKMSNTSNNNSFNEMDINGKLYIDLFLVLIFPYNGILNFLQLKLNQNIGVLLPQNLYKKASVSLPIIGYDTYVLADLDIRNIYKPCLNYYPLSLILLYNDLLSVPLLSGKVSFKMLKPNKNFSDFNFMFDKYGQFLTYRTQNKRYYNYNGKSYKLIFADYTVTRLQLNDEWYKITTIIDKNFQGNTLISFNLNLTWKDLVSLYKYDIIKLEIKNISIEVII